MKTLGRGILYSTCSRGFSGTLTSPQPVPLGLQMSSLNPLGQINEECSVLLVFILPIFSVADDCCYDGIICCYLDTICLGGNMANCRQEYTSSMAVHLPNHVCQVFMRSQSIHLCFYKPGISTSLAQDG